MKNKQTKHLNSRFSAFTMAEILLSLTIIGVVAAITLPSLTGNINERTWATQKKALFSRFSQAIALMPTMNGYGVKATDAETIAKASETFITSGLSKVLKINNICGPDDARFDCGFSSKFTNGANSKINLPVDIDALNTGIKGAVGATTITIKNTKAAAFETANGESILAFYNPNCTAENVLINGASASGEPGFYAKQQVCANFMFDLNGKKGPNTFGKDIGFMTVIYSSDSKVVMPMQPRSLNINKKHADASKECQKLENGEYRLPNIEELMSIYYNKSIAGENAFGEGSSHTWSATSIDSSTAYTFGGSYGIKYPIAKDSPRGVVCVQR